MSEKRVQIKDAQGNLLFPKTKASVVYNDNNEALGGVEAGAQVNKIEKIKLNGVELNIVNKEVDVVLPAAAEYSVAKDAEAESGFSATYHLTKDGVNVGAAINIPKDMVVQSGSVKTCETADVPVEGYEVGDKYIDLILANAANEHIYIKVTDLIDVYTNGYGLSLSNGQFSVDTSVIATVEGLNTKQDTLTWDNTPTADSANPVTSAGIKSALDLKADQSAMESALAGKQALITASAKLASDLVDDSESANKFVTATEKSTWNAKQNAIDTNNKLSADLVSVGSTNAVITLAEKAGYDGLDAAKADKATTLAGYGITDGMTYEELA